MGTFKFIDEEKLEKAKSSGKLDDIRGIELEAIQKITDTITEAINGVTKPELILEVFALQIVLDTIKSQINDPLSMIKLELMKKIYGSEGACMAVPVKIEKEDE